MASEIVHSIWIRFPIHDPGSQCLWILRLNPLASLVEVYRDVVFTGRVPEIHLWLVAFVVGVAGWILGALIFVRFRETLVESV